VNEEQNPQQQASLVSLLIPVFIVAACLGAFIYFWKNKESIDAKGAFQDTANSFLGMSSSGAPIMVGHVPATYAEPTPSIFDTLGTPVVATPDPQAAARAAQTESRRQVSDALYFWSGLGGKIDETQARALLEKSAASGEPMGEAALALFRHLERLGFRRIDPRFQLNRRVMESIRETAAKRDAEASYLLAMLLDDRLETTWKSPSESFNWIQKAARQDYPPAMRELGLRYRDGIGTEESESQAIHWLGLAAQEGDALAMADLARLCEAPGASPHDLAEAARWRQAAADRGHPESARVLGELLAAGRGVPANETKAVELFRQAMEWGDAPAAGRLGWMMAEGKGVPQDEAKAMELLRKAAESGDARSMIRLGRLSELGRGGPRDEMRANLWYRKAAESQDPEGLNAFGWFQERVLGGDFEAISSYRRAAEKGHPEGAYNLARMVDQGRGAKRDEQGAHKLYRQATDLGCDPSAMAAIYFEAAQAGNVAGMFNLAWMLERGRGISPDIATAAQWHRKAAEKGSIASMARLGALLLEGRGMERNYAEARKYLTQAASKGDGESMLLLGKMSEEGLGVPRDSRDAAQWYERARNSGSSAADDAYNRLIMSR
jgi:TPR repeat protein